MKKLTLILFTEADEAAFERELRSSVPELRIVDDQRWPKAEPPILASITASEKALIYLWNPATAPTLPSMKHVDGVSYQGPTAGVVVQFARSRMKDGGLFSGAVSAGFTEPNQPMADFTRHVWRALAKVSSNKLMTVEMQTRKTLAAETSSFRAGLDAIAWCRADAERYFSNSGPYWMLPRD